MQIQKSFLGFSIVCPISKQCFAYFSVSEHYIFSNNQFAQYKDKSCYVILPFSVN